MNKNKQNLVNLNESLNKPSLIKVASEERSVDKPSSIEPPKSN